MAAKTLQNENRQKTVLWDTNFPFENDDFLMFKDGTNEFRDPENIE